MDGLEVPPAKSRPRREDDPQADEDSPGHLALELVAEGRRRTASETRRCERDRRSRRVAPGTADAHGAERADLERPELLVDGRRLRRRAAGDPGKQASRRARMWARTKPCVGKLRPRATGACSGMSAVLDLVEASVEWDRARVRPIENERRLGAGSCRADGENGSRECEDDKTSHCSRTHPRGAVNCSVRPVRSTSA